MNEQLAPLLERPAITPHELFESGALPLSLAGIYDACRRGELESFRVGDRHIIPTAPLRRKLGIEPTA